VGKRFFGGVDFLVAAAEPGDAHFRGRIKPLVPLARRTKLGKMAAGENDEQQ
jgi:hypothetical protein